MSEPESVQDYALTLSFSVLCSTFDVSETAPNTQTKTRIFDKTFANLSQHGCWHCVFTETKRKKKACIELNLSLIWQSYQYPMSSSGSSSSSNQYETAAGQQNVAANARELISRIQSIKVRSDSTLSELLVDHLDGRRIFEGDTIQVKLQSGRVTRNGRYKFRIAFHTHDISRSQFLEHPIFTSFLDIYTYFEPEQYWKDTPPDVCFYFPASRAVHEPISIIAHSSALKESQYFAQRLTEVTEEKATRGSPFYGVLCNITEFTPQVFRAMLRYLYTGRLRLKKRHEEAQRRTTSRTAQNDSETSGTTSEIYTFGVFETGGRRKKRRGEPGAVYFEDLYRISERYEIPTLKALSLKAMQCSLNMSVAISLLAKCRPEGREEEKDKDMWRRVPEAILNRLQWAMAKDSVKEYIQFFGTEVTTSATDAFLRQNLSVEERNDMINSLGEDILSNLYRFWE
ncbi:hypothetical protein BG015_009023 [Linnemannia schmuckeri]|uniref:BTB domain-containing protein n=1 Tax=Linnemannia schmuckeri TaxID=64567 RepID=A0A9P5RWM6_9FUNG|nr:hypothetical protein BG015_009023 [Linnemannia schmuckeri]